MSDLQARIVETVARLGRPHCAAVRRELGADPIEFSFALHDLVEHQVLVTESGMLPRCWVAGTATDTHEEAGR